MDYAHQTFEFLDTAKDVLQHVSYESIYKSICGLPKHAIPSAILGKGWYIDRVRLNEIEKETGKLKLFTNVEEISYVHDKDILDKYVGVGRANAPKQAVFYGAVESPQIKQPRATAYFETSQVLKEMSEHNDDILEVFTLSRWRVLEDIEIVEMIFGDEHLAKSEQAKASYEKQFQHIKGSEYEKYYTEYGRLFGNQFSRNDIRKNETYKYNISAAYANFIYNKTKLKGLTYPSVNALYEGQNVALLPEIVDKCLRLEMVTMLDFKRENGIQYPLGAPSKIVTDFGKDNMEFVWEDYDEAKYISHK